MKQVIYFKQLIVIASLLNFSNVMSQTVGTVQYDNGTFEGYSMLHPLNFDTTYLIDNCGKVVNRWANNYTNGMFAEITTNGRLIRSCIDPNAPYFAGGGGTGILQECTWDGTVIWQHSIADSNFRIHHDMEILPNGNLLVVSWELKTASECIQAGRIPSSMAMNELWFEVIYELEKTYPLGANVVWEWHAWDHLVQDYSSSSANFGSVQANFRRFDINKGNENNLADWAHINAIHYNADLDHIILSSPNFNEIWMIDHGTTTAEAADSTGGNRGRGGDLLWRWGNPASYNQGTFLDQEFHFQHDCQWVEEGVRFDEHISVFNNRDSINGQLGSKVKIVRAHFDTLSNSYPVSNGVFLPTSPDYTYNLADSLYAPRVSGVQVLPNDNLLIASGSNGHIIEIDSNENVLWQYVVPIKLNGTAMTQGDIPLNNKDVFKMKRYTTDYVGFDGHDMTPGNQIELNPLACTNSISLEEIGNLAFQLYPNPADNYFLLSGLVPHQDLLITDALGRVVYSLRVQESTTLVDCSVWTDGVYFVIHNAQRSALLVY